MVRFSLGNLVAVTVLAVLGIVAFKTGMRIVPIRGLSDLAASV